MLQKNKLVNIFKNMELPQIVSKVNLIHNNKNKEFMN